MKTKGKIPDDGLAAGRLNVSRAVVRKPISNGLKS